MKKQALTILIILNSLLIFGQKDLPEYGEIDKSDLQLKECEFDKNADAYKLLSIGDVNYEVSGGTFTILNERRVRIKILNEKGLEKKAHVIIKIYSKLGNKAIKGISGNTYNLDNSGNIATSTLAKDSVKFLKISNKSTEVSFNMPNVKVGSVIEYKISYIEKSIANIDDWYFQDDIPTRMSVYRISVPFMFKFETQLFAYQEMEQQNDIVNQNVTYKKNRLDYASSMKVYIIKDVPALRKEPYMADSKDYLERIAFRLSQVEYGNGEKEDVNTTWPQVTSELLNDPDFGMQLKKPLPHTKKLDESLQNVTDDYNKMKVIYDYVRKNMKWNGEESIYTSNGVKPAWEKKSGNASKLNFALIALMRDAGLKAYPLIASTKDNGTVNTQSPYLLQFNITMACVIIGEKNYILNAADKYNPANMMPSSVIDNDGFIVDADKGGWIKLSDNNAAYKNEVSISAQITPHDSLTGSSTIYSYGYSKNAALKRWKDERDTLGTYYTQSHDGLKIENIQFSNEDIEAEPLQQNFDFSMPVTTSEGKKYITLNLFQRWDKNPFIVEERKTDIDFNYKQSYSITGRIVIPEGYQFGKLPKDIEVIMSDSGIVFKRSIKQEKNSIEFNIILDYTKTFYETDTYPLLQTFYKKIYSALNEQIEIKE